jgi:hypothetical protein
VSKWKLEGFKDALERLDEGDHSLAVPIKAQVLRWLLVEFATDPFPPGSNPLLGEFDLTWWFVRLPFGSSPDTRIVCIYRVDHRRRTITCHALDELRPPI